MIAEARRKAAGRSVSVRFEEADAEQLPFAPGSFDLVISRHLLWTLPHPEAAIDEWIRVLRTGGAPGRRGQPPRRGVRAAGVGERPDEPGVRGGRRSASRSSGAGRGRRSRSSSAASTASVNVGSDPLADLVAAQAQRMVDEGREPRTRRRYVVWGEARKAV